MGKYLQWKIICGETTCKETLYKPRPHNAKTIQRYFAE